MIRGQVEESGGGDLIGYFQLYSETTITNASMLPTLGERKTALTIRVGSAITDPQNSQPLTPGLYYWNVTAQLWQDFVAGSSAAEVLVSFNSGDWLVDPNDSTQYYLPIDQSATLGANVSVARVVNSDSPTGNPTFKNAVLVNVAYSAAGVVQLRISRTPDTRFTGSVLLM